jgi:DNA (cytosine-5)-methyltransferase 1
MRGIMNELALFAGAGGGILGGQILGWKTVCAVEIEPYPASILAQRQNDGFLPAFPIWDDVRTFDGTPWRGIIDVISGGFPCQDISTAGKGEGLDGEKSGLWSQMARIIGDVQPRAAFIENSAILNIRGLDRVLCDLAKMGYDAKWGVIPASCVGADHKRERTWIVAHSISNGLERRDNGNQKRQRKTETRPVEGFCKSKVFNDIPAPNAFGNSNGMASRVDRLKSIGNGQVPQCAAYAWRILNT